MSAARRAREILLERVADARRKAHQRVAAQNPGVVVVVRVQRGRYELWGESAAVLREALGYALPVGGVELPSGGVRLNVGQRRWRLCEQVLIDRGRDVIYINPHGARVWPRR